MILTMNKKLILESKNGEYFLNEHKIDSETFFALSHLGAQTDLLISNHEPNQYLQYNGLHCLSCGGYNVNPSTVTKLVKNVLSNIIKERNSQGSDT